eukprot:gene17641-23219_t
MKVLLL